MTLSIESETVDRLARELTELTGESVADAVARALALRLEAERCRISAAARAARINKLITRMQSYPVLDPRPMDEILGYNEWGTFE